MKKDEFITNDISYDPLKINNDKLLEVITERVAIISRIIEDKKKMLAQAPKGKLHISKRGKYVSYYIRNDPTDKTGEYISKKRMDLVKVLAQKSYNLLVNKCLEKHLADILKYKTDINRFTKELLSKDISKSELLIPLIIEDEEYVKRWSEITYQGRSFEDNAKEYYSSKGERVRSKSEVIIADTLSRHNIPYRYEYPTNMGGRIIYPDFTCLNVKKRQNIIYEHFGMMDNAEYCENALLKIKSYESNGYKLGENFIFTMESSEIPLSTRMIELVIDHYL